MPLNRRGEEASMEGGHCTRTKTAKGKNQELANPASEGRSANTKDHRGQLWTTITWATHKIKDGETTTRAPNEQGQRRQHGHHAEKREETAIWQLLGPGSKPGDERKGRRHATPQIWRTTGGCHAHGTWTSQRRRGGCAHRNAKHWCTLPVWSREITRQDEQRHPC
jgi:hypothetical protein